MKKTEFAFQSPSDGLRIHVLVIEPDTKPKAVVQLAHGMGEYKERYVHLMEALAKRGFVCAINDHRGHGKSIAWPQDLGYCGREGAKYLVDDMHELTKQLKEKYTGLPFFLYGHSMGSLAARCYRAQYGGELDGLVLSGSPGKSDGAAAMLKVIDFLIATRGANYRSWLIEKVSGGMSKRFQHEGSKYAWLSTQKDVVRQFEEDPMCGFRYTLNGYKAIAKLLIGAYLPAPAQNPQMPVLFIAGADDPCLPDVKGFSAAVEAMRANGYVNVRSILYPGLRHEIHNEPQREQVFADIAGALESWI